MNNNATFIDNKNLLTITQNNIYLNSNLNTNSLFINNNINVKNDCIINNNTIIGSSLKNIFNKF